MIFGGAIWTINNLQEFLSEEQVLGEIEREEAMIFSGGQEEHFHIVKMLSGILEDKGIKSI